METKDNPYSESIPRLKESLVVFLDILGFSDMVRHVSNSGHAELFLSHLMNTLNEAKVVFSPWADSDIRTSNDWAVKTFTDNIVIGSPYSGCGESESGHIFGSVSLYQLGLALRGCFVRGGLSIGPHYMDNDIVFGSALIDACEIEKNQAKFPRIVLSQKAFSMVESHIKFYSSPNFAPQNRDLLIDEDGTCFLNYLEAAIIEYSPEFFYGSIQTLSRHKQQVVKNLNRYRLNPNCKKTYEKFKWVAKYHNFFCRQYFSWEQDLLIELDDQDDCRFITFAEL